MAVTFIPVRDSLAFPSEWSAESAWRQKWLAAASVPERSRPMLATAEKGPLLRRPRAAATIGDRLREAQLQTRAASVDILWRGMVKYPCQSLPERMQAECQWRTGSWGFLIAFRLSSLTGQGSLDESRFTALSWPNFTGVVVMGQGSVLKLEDQCPLGASLA